MSRLLKKLVLGLAGGLLIASAGSARADIDVALTGGPVQAPGYFTGYDQFTYTINVTDLEHLQAGSSFTIYDVHGLFNALAPTGWTASISSLGLTPEVGVSDDPNLGNVTYTYTGATTGVDPTFTGFEVNVDPGFGGETQGAFAAQADDGDFAPADNIGMLTVPSAAAPLPASVFAFPLALAAAFGYLKLRRNASLV